MRTFWLLVAVVGASYETFAQGAHPLAPLSAREIRDASRIFRDSGRVPRGAEFSQLTLEEPPKEAV